MSTEFFRTHPEYLSEIDGVRRDGRTQLCLTTPDVARIVTERLLAAIRKDPGGRIVSVSQNDRASLGEEFPVACPVCGGDIRLIAFITEPGPSRKILAHLGEPLEPPPVSSAPGPPTDWGELVQVHNDRPIFQGRIDELPLIDIRSL